MDQATIARNENSWNRTLFLDPSLFATKGDWPRHAMPSICINKTICESVVVLNPNLNITKFQRKYHRDGEGVPEDVKSEINAKRSTMTQDQLLTMAANCNIHQGFWFLSCKKKNNYWDHYFGKITDFMYKMAACELIESDNQFLKIEARWNNSANMGIIMISNCVFSSKNTINETSATLQALINAVHVYKGHVGQWLSYKPQFYVDSGFDVNFSHDLNTNIYTIDLLTAKRYSYKDGASKVNVIPVNYNELILTSSPPNFKAPCSFQVWRWKCSIVLYLF